MGVYPLRADHLSWTFSVGVQFSGGGGYSLLKWGLSHYLRGLIHYLMGGGLFITIGPFLAYLRATLNGSIVCLTMAFAIGLGPYPGLTAPNALPGG